MSTLSRLATYRSVLVSQGRLTAALMKKLPSQYGNGLIDGYSSSIEMFDSLFPEVKEADERLEPRAPDPARKPSGRSS